MSTTPKGIIGDASISAVEILGACESITASAMFANAPRMRRLLRFLVEKSISGDYRDMKEYAIGIEVFDRKPSAYCTKEDPSVRVQVGRLRKKLNEYYATDGTSSDIRISIPLGTYIPTIQRVDRKQVCATQDGALALKQIQCIARCKHGESFAQGLHEELVYQLFKEFGDVALDYPLLKPASNGCECLAQEMIPNRGVNHLIEGSVRIDSERIRASVRVVDVSLGCVTWSQQFDRKIFFAITQQEELASSICGALKQFLRG
jgi:TolB-like protein